MILSICYVVVQRVLQVVALRFRSNDFKELEIIVLRHELDVLRRRSRRPAMTWTDRLFLAAASRVLPRARWRSFIITPATLLRWHRRLVANRWTYPRSPGRPPLPRDVRALVVRLARDNPRWGYQRLVGELKGLGISLSATTVRTLVARRRPRARGHAERHDVARLHARAPAKSARNRFLHGRDHRPATAVRALRH